MSVVLLRNGAKVVKEADVVKMLSHGLSADQISIQTGINKRTLEARLLAIRRSYGVVNAAHLVGEFFRKGLIE